MNWTIILELVIEGIAVIAFIKNRKAEYVKYLKTQEKAKMTAKPQQNVSPDTKGGN